jgi:hypothetical protein
MGLMRDMFGPSRDEIWRQLSGQINAAFEPGTGLFGAGTRVEAQHGQWIVTLDTYTISTGKSSATFTRLRAPYVNPAGFRFNVYDSAVFGWLRQTFGVEDIVVGDAAFDQRFVVQSTSPAEVTRLLSNPQVRAALEAQPDIHLQVKDDDRWFRAHFPQGVDELYFQTYGVVKDLPRLEGLFELFALVLDELCRMGSAYDGPAGIRL